MAKRRTVARPHIEKPYPCQTPGCAGELAPRNERGEPIDMEREGASQWVCARGGGPGCGFTVNADDMDDNREERCPSDGAPLAFDPDEVGETCGGLRLRGWNKCAHCGGTWITRRGKPDSGGRDDGRWRLSAGGASLDAGSHRLRVEGRGKGADRKDITTLMARISRMPAFEAALEKIAAGGLDALDAEAMRRIANEALSIGDGVEEIEA